ncbi:MAG: CapA family protein [Clostridia bacterium]|nr:CapA family protein [Clostridia bacterium]
MKFSAAGDAIIQRRIYEGYDFEPIREVLLEGDARFFNLETTVNREGECFASQFSGGTYIRTNPEMVEDMKKFGFNMTTFNNNHAFDFSYKGMEKTLEALNESGLVHAGVGRNMGEASAPAYLDTPNGRVALISINTCFEPSMMAGGVTERFPGRPGVFGVRHNTKVVVNKETLATLRDIAKRTMLNAEEEMEIKDGYMKPIPEHLLNFGGTLFELGEKEGVYTSVNEADMKRLERSIAEAKFLADAVLVSVHSHTLKGDNKEDPADFIVELAHKCIDAGADAIIGHGPHLLQPIEVYKDKPIFYSLGDFILELYSVPVAPADFYGKVGVHHEAGVHELLRTRSKEFTIGLMEQRKMLQTVVPVWEMEDGKLTSLKLLPLEGKMRDKSTKNEMGLPFPVEDDDIFERLSVMCKPYGVSMKKNGKYIECSW